jgi:hypothetical protein
MSRNKGPAWAFALVALASCAQRGSAQSGAACEAASNARAAQTVASLRERATGTDSLSAVVRQAYSLPLLSDTAVSLVTDEALCQRAATAYHREIGDTIVRLPILVMRAGDRYVVESLWMDPERIGGLGTSRIIFDTSFVRIAKFLR